MNIKRPMVLDTSYGNEGSDWSGIADDLAAMYYKATEGEHTVDTMFAYTHAFLKRANKPAAPYLFYRETWYGFPRDPVKQARFFYDTIQAAGGLRKGDRIILDAEDGNGMTIQKILACGREMRRLFNQWPWLYTGYYYLKDSTKGYDKLTAADIADLKQMKLIISCYPTYPDQYNSLPSQYIPDPQFFGEVIGWQYAGDVPSTIVFLPKVKGRMDFNLFSVKALQDWKEGYDSIIVYPSPPPPVEPPTYEDDFTLDSYETVNFVGLPVKYHVFSFDLSKYDWVQDDHFNYLTTLQWAQRNDVDFAFNGLPGWYQLTNKKGRPGRSVLDGPACYHGRGDSRSVESVLYISPDNKFSLARPRTVWNAYGFPNLLIRDGIIQKPDQHPLSDIRARLCLGVNKEQSRLFVNVVDGKDYWEKEGMNFEQSSSIMRSLGCDLAVWGDGGGSVTAIIKNLLGYDVIGKPWGEDPVVVNGNVYKLRYVAAHFGLRRKA